MMAAKMSQDGPASKSAERVKMSKKTDVTVAEKPKTTALATTELFESLAGDGLENVTAKDLIIPRITILQGLSPQVQPKKPEYIKGATVGDLCDVGTNEVFEAPMLFLPVLFMKQYLEWAPRESGKGLVAIHNDEKILDACKLNDRNQHINAQGNYIAETAQFFGLNLSAGGRRSFLPMTSTQLKKARRWLSLSSSERLTRADGSTYTPPLYYRVYQISTVEESNSKGDWIGYRIERGPSLPEYDAEGYKNILAEAKDFKASIQRGEIRGDVESTDDRNASEGAM